MPETLSNVTAVTTGGGRLVGVGEGSQLRVAAKTRDVSSTFKTGALGDFCDIRE